MSDKKYALTLGYNSDGDADKLAEVQASALQVSSFDLADVASNHAPSQYQVLAWSAVGDGSFIYAPSTITAGGGGGGSFTCGDLASCDLSALRNVCNDAVAANGQVYAWNGTQFCPSTLQFVPTQGTANTTVNPKLIFTQAPEAQAGFSVTSVGLNVTGPTSFNTTPQVNGTDVVVDSDLTPYLTKTEANGFSSTLLPTNEAAGFSATLLPTAEATAFSATLLPKTEAAGFSSTLLPTAEATAFSATLLPKTEANGFSSTLLPTAEAAGFSATLLPKTEANGFSSTLLPTAEAAGFSATLLPKTEANGFSSTLLPTAEAAGFSATLLPTAEANGFSSTLLPTAEAAGFSSTLVVSSTAGTNEIYYNNGTGPDGITTTAGSRTLIGSDARVRDLSDTADTDPTAGQILQFRGGSYSPVDLQMQFGGITVQGLTAGTNNFIVSNAVLTPPGSTGKGDSTTNSFIFFSGTDASATEFVGDRFGRTWVTGPNQNIVNGNFLVYFSSTDAASGTAATELYGGPAQVLHRQVGAPIASSNSTSLAELVSYTLPANHLAVGDVDIVVRGRQLAQGSNLRWNFKIGGTNILNSSISQGTFSDFTTYTMHIQISKTATDKQLVTANFRQSTGTGSSAGRGSWAGIHRDGQITNDSAAADESTNLTLSLEAQQSDAAQTVTVDHFRVTLMPDPI